MRHVAAYAMLVLGGNSEPSAADVEKTVKEAGATVDKEKCVALCEALKGKEFHELVATGMQILSSMGGSAAAHAGCAAEKVKAVREEEEIEEYECNCGGRMFVDSDDY